MNKRKFRLPKIENLPKKIVTGASFLAIISCPTEFVRPEYPKQYFCDLKLDMRDSNLSLTPMKTEFLAVLKKYKQQVTNKTDTSIGYINPKVQIDNRLYITYEKGKLISGKTIFEYFNIDTRNGDTVMTRDFGQSGTFSLYEGRCF